MIDPQPPATPTRTARTHSGKIRRRFVDAIPYGDDRPVKTPRRRHAAMRLSLRLQAIEAFERATGQRVATPVVRKIALKPEIEVIATVDGRQREMRWSYADGTLVRLV